MTACLCFFRELDYLQVEIVQSVTVKLDDSADISLIQVIVATTATYVHSYCYMITYIRGVIVAVGKITRFQIRQYCSITASS